MHRGIRSEIGGPISGLLFSLRKELQPTQPCMFLIWDMENSLGDYTSGKKRTLFYIPSARRPNKELRASMTGRDPGVTTGLGTVAYKGFKMGLQGLTKDYKGLLRGYNILPNSSP